MSDLQKKLFDYHAQPSDRVWDEINIALETKGNKTLSEKLYKYEVKPPASAWDNIFALLEETQAPVVPMGRPFSKRTKYLSAAASIIAIAIVTSIVLNKRTSADSVEMPVVKQTEHMPSFPQPSPDQQDALVENKTNASGQLSLSSDKKSNRTRTHKIPLETYSSDSNDKNIDDRVLQNNYPLQDPEYLDRYIVFSTASGEAFRLSKKLLDLFACSSSDVDCRQNIMDIQEKLADPSVAVGGDFPGVLAILQNMNNP